MRTILLFFLMLPLLSFSQTNISTRELVELFDKHRNDTAAIVKFAFEKGFKERNLFIFEKYELNSLEIIWYENIDDPYYTEAISVFFTEPHYTLAYRTARRELFVQWYNDLPRLGFQKVKHYNGKGFTKTTYRKGKIGIVLYQDLKKSEYDNYDMTISYDFSTDK